MKASSLSFRTATIMALLGMTMGIAMAASGDHSVMPAHAHLNLLGWVSLFLFGIYYRLHPTADASRLAAFQVGAWTLATLVLATAVAFIHLGYEAAEPVAAVGSLVLVASMGLFAFLVFRPAASDLPARVVLSPAE
jgi:hypothetical protein